MPNPWDEEWTLGERLGKGGQGDTLHATHKEATTIQAALKRLRNNKNMQARRRMVREVASLQTLANKGGAVPRVLDHNTGLYEDPKVQLFVVMDLIEGPTLAKFIEENHPIPVDDAVAFALSLLKTIKIAHEHDILHRDLKPENMIVRNAEESDLVIVDYGLSFNATDKSLTEPDDTFRNRFLDLPETNTTTGNSRDPRSDLTAISGILYFCLTKRIPGVLQDEDDNLPHLRPGCSVRDVHDDKRNHLIEDFLTRGFAPNISNRFQTIDEVEEGLRGLQSNDAIDESEPEQLAKMLSTKLRLEDKSTQEAIVKQQAGPLFQYIEKEATNYRKLDQFQLHNEKPREKLKSIENPAGLRIVLEWGKSVVLSVQNHGYISVRRYAVAVRQRQCILLSVDYDLNRKSNTTLQSQVDALRLGWKEVATYEGVAQPIHNLVSVSYRKWLTSKMNSIAEQILG